MEFVQSTDQILDVGPIEWRDERPANRNEHLPGDFVGLVLLFEDFLAVLLELFAALEGAPQRLGARQDGFGVPHEKIEEAILPGHQLVEPAEHWNLAEQCGMPARY